MSLPRNLLLAERWEVEFPHQWQGMLVSEIFEGLRAGKVLGTQKCRSPAGEEWQVEEVFVLLGGRYGLLSELGHGTFGAVFEAWDVKNGRSVAVKRPGENFEDADRRYVSELYSSESICTARLALADNVVKVLDYHPEMPYLVLEYCDGGTLRQRMKSPYTVADVIAWAHQLARVMRCAHGLEPDKMVHRDLKPTNLLLAGGKLKVADFGGAMMFPPTSALLRTLAPWGFTRAYAPPEAGAAKTPAPPAFDIWSFGVILYELLCGARPFRDEAEIKSAALPADFPLRPEFLGAVEDELVAIVRDCLQKDPRARPSATDCFTRLERLNMNFSPTVPLEQWVISASDQLYPSNQVVLRELLQNAVDALRMVGPGGGAAPRVDVHLRGQGRRLCVADAGVGMTLDDQVNGFWKPFGSLKKRLPEETRRSLGIVGQFGIGAYASFRMAKAIAVVSRPPDGGKPQGTRGALNKPLRELASYDELKIEFSVLTQAQAASIWGNKEGHGTVVLLDLVDPFDPDEAKKILTEIAEFLPEPIYFEGAQLNPVPATCPSSSGPDVRVAEIDLSSYDTTPEVAQRLQSVRVLVSRSDSDSPALVLGEIQRGDGGRIPCRGSVWLAPVKDRQRLRVLKHGFQFVTLNATKEWVGRATSARTPKALNLDGVLDLPFVSPNLARDGFDERSTRNLKALFTGLSWFLVEEIAAIGGQLLKDCLPVYDFIWDQALEERLKVLALYPLTEFPGGEPILCKDVLERAGKEKELRVYYLTKAADRKTRDKARALANLDDCLVIEIDEPTYWRGHCLEKILEHCAKAKNLAGVECFTDVLDEEEMGDWRSYRGFFTQALDDVIGRGRQLLLARIQPPELTLVFPQQGGVVYANFNNPEIAGLPGRELCGPELESLIRKWTFGKVEAAQIEEALKAQGKLVVVQEVMKLRVVDDPTVKRYIPAREDLFLLIREREGSRYCLRVNLLHWVNLRGFLDSSGRLDPRWKSELNWTGNMFFYTLRPDDPGLHSLVMKFSTSIILSNPHLGDRINGNVPEPFRFDLFDGPNLDGPQPFLVLPPWVGELLDQERMRKGAVHVSVSCQLIDLKDLTASPDEFARDQPGQDDSSGVRPGG